ncbi:MAG: hypothetical protein QM758_27455 [Armatimonas sp.]
MDTLKEIQKALKRESAATVLDRYTDNILIQLLRRQKRPSGIVLWCWMAFLGIMIIVFLGAFARFWKLPNTPFIFFIFQIHLVQHLFKIKPEVLEPIKLRLEKASLPTLLDAYTLNIPQIDETIQAALAKRLAVATTEDLEMLAPEQRKQLVRFTLIQARVNPLTYPLDQPYLLPETQAQAATVGFLALASLKLPGAQHISSQKIRTTNPNLKQAIEEYQLAMKAFV